MFDGIEPDENANPQYRKESIISLVASLASFSGGIGIVTAIVGIVFALMSKKQYRELDTMAKAGFILGCIGAVFSVIILFA